MKKRIEYKEINYDPNEPLRLNKFLANAGICSRREADEFIQAGVVTVNGEVVTELGTKILRTDVATLLALTVTTLRTLAVTALWTLTIAALRTLAITTLALLTVATFGIVVVTWTIATLWALRSIALQSSTKTLWTETALIVVVIAIAWTLIGWACSCMNAWTW